jgi:hypothetical protein
VFVQILRLGIFELIHDQMPSHAMNEHVELAKHHCNADAVRFINGVLREVTRRRVAGNVPLPTLPASPASPLPESKSKYAVLGHTETSGQYSCIEPLL